MWIPLALFSATLSSFRRVSEKELSMRIHHLTLGWLVQALSLPFLLVITLVGGAMINPFALGDAFWVPFAIICLGFYPLNNFLYFKSLALGDLSSVLPIYSLVPALSLLISWATLGEKPSVIAAAGVAVTIIAVYVISLKGATLHNPITPFMRDKSSLYALFSACNLAAVGVLDKMAIQASNPLFVSLLGTMGAALALFMLSGMRKTQSQNGVRGNVTTLASIGGFQGASNAAYMYALSLGPIAYVNAVRSSQIIIGSIFGIVLLKEPLTRQKIGAYSLIAVGLTLLAAS